MKTKSRIIVFILAYLSWLALTGVGHLQEIIAGIFVAALVSLIGGQFLVTSEKTNAFPKRLIYGIGYFFKFLWEMVKANVHVAYIVIHPNLPIKPGIVKINTTLEKDTSLTILSNSITLTPGTLTVDVSPKNHNLYVHWIDVKSTDVEENSKNIGARFEPMLREVFE